LKKVSFHFHAPILCALAPCQINLIQLPLNKTVFGTRWINVINWILCMPLCSLLARVPSAPTVTAFTLVWFCFRLETQIFYKKYLNTSLLQSWKSIGNIGITVNLSSQIWLFWASAMQINNSCITEFQEAFLQPQEQKLMIQHTKERSLQRNKFRYHLVIESVQTAQWNMC
jgi:hypothetical protein